MDGVGEGDDAVGVLPVGPGELVRHAPRRAVRHELGHRHGGGRGQHVPEHGHLRLELEPQENLVLVVARRRRRRRGGGGEVEPQRRVPLRVPAAGAVRGGLDAVRAAAPARRRRRRRVVQVDGGVEAGRVEGDGRPDAPARDPRDVDGRRLRPPPRPPPMIHRSIASSAPPVNARAPNTYVRSRRGENERRRSRTSEVKKGGLDRPS